MMHNHLVLIIGIEEKSIFNEKYSMICLFRYIQKYRVNGTDYRTLTKMYGLRFVVTITGKGGQFNIVNLFVAIGMNDLLLKLRN